MAEGREPMVSMVSPLCSTPNTPTARPAKEPRDVGDPWIPCPTSRWEATLLGLPTELQQIISGFLSTKDLFALRRTSTHFASVVVAQLAQILAEHLEGLHVLVTEEGFKSLAAITRIPEYRQHIRWIKFHNLKPVLSGIKRSDGRLKDEQIARFTSHMAVNDTSFLAQAFRDMQDCPIHIYVSWFTPATERLVEACGGEALLRHMLLDEEQRKEMQCIYSSWVTLGMDRVELIEGALAANQIDRPIGVVSVLSYSIFDNIKVTPPKATGTANLAWITKLDIRAHEYDPLDHLDTPESQWALRLLKSASRAETLSLRGCRRAAECENCPLLRDDHRYSERQCHEPGRGCQTCAAISQGLETTVFTNLTTLDLQYLCFTESCFIEGILHTSQDTLCHIKLSHVELKTGSWRAIFQALHDMRKPHLDQIFMARLYQPLQSADYDYVEHWLDEEYHGVDLYGDKITTLLEEILVSFRVAASYIDSYHDQGYAAVVFSEDTEQAQDMYLDERGRELLDSLTLHRKLGCADGRDATRVGCRHYLKQIRAVSDDGIDEGVDGADNDMDVDDDEGRTDDDGDSDSVISLSFIS